MQRQPTCKVIDFYVLFRDVMRLLKKMIGKIQPQTSKNDNAWASVEQNCVPAPHICSFLFHNAPEGR